jgi:hypothetical protein
MDEAIIILGALYLCGYPVGKALAICSIISGVFNVIIAVLNMVKERME